MTASGCKLIIRSSTISTLNLDRRLSQRDSSSIHQFIDLGPCLRIVLLHPYDTSNRRYDPPKMTTTLPTFPPDLHRHTSHSSLTSAQSTSRETYLSTPDPIKYASIDRVLDRRGGRTDEAFVGGQEVSRVVVVGILPFKLCGGMYPIQGKKGRQSTSQRRGRRG